MQKTLKAVVKDHRLPADYHYHFNQPMTSSVFLKNLRKFFIHRQMTKQNITVPAYLVFVSTPFAAASPLRLRFPRFSSLSSAPST